MIKVLKKGRTFQITCRNCLAVLSYQMGDVQQDKSEIRHSKHIVCPECGNDVYVYPELDRIIDLSDPIWNRKVTTIFSSMLRDEVRERNNYSPS